MTNDHSNGRFEREKFRIEKGINKLCVQNCATIFERVFFKLMKEIFLKLNFSWITLRKVKEIDYIIYSHFRKIL